MSMAIGLTIAGSDSGGGAGIQADLKTFSALGVYGCSVITALTAQNTRAVTGVFDIPPDFIRDQMDAVFSDLAVKAVKIGMLSRPETIRAVADGLRARGPRHIVLDPVMAAKSGDALIREDAIASLREELVPLAAIITPNLPEAAVLLDERPVSSAGEMPGCAERLLSLGAKAVLLKGGHLGGRDSPDLLHDGERAIRLDARRLGTRNTHGTGCTLSSAVAAGLAKGQDLTDAVSQAKSYISAALAAADRIGVGGGHGPVHHFHALWPPRPEPPSRK